MTKDEALRLALEALSEAHYVVEHRQDVKKREQAITAIKEALAESEPNYKKALEVWLDKTEWVQETVKPHELGMHRADVLKQRIEEASPQRTWVGLTDEEIWEWFRDNTALTNESGIRIVRAIEAKLRSKNNG
jgi:hypothetical protein